MARIIQKGLESRASLSGRIRLAVGPVLEREGIELVNVTWCRSGRRGLLRIFVDKPGGVTIADCASVTSVVGDIIDAERIVDGLYTLEVSSPGLERPIASYAEMERSVGRQLRIITKDGNVTVGRLQRCSQEMIGVDVNGVDVEIPFASVVKARLALER